MSAYSDDDLIEIHRKLDAIMWHIGIRAEKERIRREQAAQDEPGLLDGPIADLERAYHSTDEELPLETEVLAELLAAFEQAAAQLDPAGHWSRACTRSITALEGHLAR